MKFLQLKEALDKVLPKAEAPEKPQPKLELPVVPFYSPKERKQTVVGGEGRTPVDRTARLVVSKAPWWAHLTMEANVPEVPKALVPERAEPVIKRPSKPKTKAKRKPMNEMPKAEKVSETDHVINAEQTMEAHRKTLESVTEADSLVKKAMDARVALDVMCDYWKQDWTKFMAEGDERLKALRVFRMSFDSETKLLMAALREVRQFFLDKDHAGEVERLKEFVELCERLQRLKTSGFLDTVADTMLKLS